MSALSAHFGEFAEPVGGGNSTIHEDVAAGDESTICAHQQRGNLLAQFSRKF
jgi:hypothetical protein